MSEPQRKKRTLHFSFPTSLSHANATYAHFRTTQNQPTWNCSPQFPSVHVSAVIDSPFTVLSKWSGVAFKQNQSTSSSWGKLQLITSRVALYNNKIKPNKPQGIPFSALSILNLLLSSLVLISWRIFHLVTSKRIIPHLRYYLYYIMPQHELH